MAEEKYLRLLAGKYPTMEAAASEIVNLKAICCLPKGTEYFFSDIHGEYEAFLHLLRSASGMVRSKIDDAFSRTISEEDREQLASLIYYPEDFLAALKLEGKKREDWKKITIFRLVEVCKEVSGKYTRSRVRKQLPEEYAYIIDELLHADNDIDKERYYGEIASALVEIQVADSFIIALCGVIRSLCIDRLHIIGDIFDRGPRADIIMNELMAYNQIDFQWGNHDISWMGAASGCKALVANVIRMAISYNNFDLLEDGYGINLRALSEFAAKVYRDDPCKVFLPHLLDENKYDPVDKHLAAKMHKAIAIIQFKLEGQLIKRHPEYEMEDRRMLEAIDYGEGTIQIEGKAYPLRDRLFPTVDPADPTALTREEEDLLNVICASFRHSTLLHEHMRFLYSHGSLYKCYNNNLLFHGCIPMREDGSFESMETARGKELAGRELLDYINRQVVDAYFLKPGTKKKENACDFMWYLWCGRKSPVYGKSKMTAFEGYFIKRGEIHKEIFNPYYELSKSRDVCERILEEFGLGDRERTHIINGHVPVKEGENPVKGGGKLFVIDGGISKAYQSKTGIAGYTLIFNSHGLNLAEHRPFDPSRRQENTSRVTRVETMPFRLMIHDTDLGVLLHERIEDLKQLVECYRTGLIRENSQD
ncbi:fructose-1,6-bisphosphatase [Anaerolentibacter hominis]|uniref:fructose-1,6-bisphosphatase n=1 Tax=Anaerolentibacter hominis TaxID=3079009 RepID=UPI0031B86AED